MRLIDTRKVGDGLAFYAYEFPRHAEPNSNPSTARQRA
jgi:hypothetical protein